MQNYNISIDISNLTKKQYDEIDKLLSGFSTFSEVKAEDKTPQLKLLIEAQDNYIKFLGEEVNRMGSFAISHSYMQCSDEVVKEGIRLREEIEKYGNTI